MKERKMGIEELPEFWRKQEKRFLRESLDGANNMYDANRYEGIARGFMWARMDLEKVLEDK